MFIPLEGKSYSCFTVLRRGARGGSSISAGRFQCFKQNTEVWELSTACVFVQKEYLSPLEKKNKTKSRQLPNCVMGLPEGGFPLKIWTCPCSEYLTVLKRFFCLFLLSPSLHASLSQGSALTWWFLPLLCDSPGWQHNLRFLSGVTVCCSALRRGIISNLQHKNLNMEQGGGCLLAVPVCPALCSGNVLLEKGMHRPAFCPAFGVWAKNAQIHAEFRVWKRRKSSGSFRMQ